MAKHQNNEMIDKQSAIKNYMQNLLWLKGIIDVQGNILDLDLFRAEIDVAINNCNTRMLRYTTVDGVVTDREQYSVLLGEEEYLKSLAKHTTNFYELKQHPIIPYEDLHKTKLSVFAKKLRTTRDALSTRFTKLFTR